MNQFNRPQVYDRLTWLPVIHSNRLPVRQVKSRLNAGRCIALRLAAAKFLLSCGLLFTFQPNGSAAQSANLNRGNTAIHANLRLAQDVFRKINQQPSAPFSPPVRAEENQVKAVGTSLRSFGIPFQINADNNAFIEVQLYLSRDLGSTWNFVDRQTTDQKDFPFKSSQDGEYWFSMKTLDRDRRLLPEGNPRPELKIIVDTVKPTLDFQVEADAAGRIVCRWTAKDKNLRPESLQIFYQNAISSNSVNDWKRVPINLNGIQRNGVYSDQIAWWPETKERQIRVVVEIKDIAGNAAQANRLLTIQSATWRHSSEATAQINDRPQPPRDIAIVRSQLPQILKGLPQSPLPNNYATTQFRSPQERFGTVSAKPQTAAKPIQSAPKSLPPLNSIQNVDAPAAVEITDSIVWESQTKREFSKIQTNVATARPQSFPLNSKPPAQPAPRQLLTRPSLDAPPNESTTKISKGIFIGESSTIGATNQYRVPQAQAKQSITAPTLGPAVSSHSWTVPPSDGQYSTQRLPQLPTATRTENLTTALKAAGETDRMKPYKSQPSPVDISGQQASRSTTIVKKPKMNTEDQVIGSMRFDLQYTIDAIDPSGVERVILWRTRDGVRWESWASDPDSRSPFPVSVEENGTYGFRIVVHSKDGLTGTGPSTGDPADIWITVDTEKPQTRINSVPYGRGREAGQLVINYTANDSELTLRPITLAYSSNLSGPWIIIDENLSNSGQHLWKPGTDIPEKIFLRIEARDKAGNIGTHLLQQPIDISGLVPSGTISGVSVVGSN
jgi:hypothetical protein